MHILLAVQAVPSELQKIKLTGENTMKKFQTPNPLKVSKRITANHNQSALKVRKGTLKERWTMFLYANIRCGWMNHNESALKVCK
jgi:hypothetical protein